MTPHPISVLLRILVVFLTVLLAVALAERSAGILQKRYRASVTLQVQGPTLTAAPPSSETIAALAASPAVLVPALSVLGKDASDEALREWGRSLTVREIRNTELLQIEATTRNQADAAGLANAVAEEVQRQLIAGQQSAIDKSLEAFKEKMTAQQKTVAALSAELEQARAESRIVDFWPDATDSHVLPLAEALPKLKAQIAEAKALHEKVVGLTDGELLEEISQATPLGSSLDPTLSDLSLKIQQASEEEKQAATGNGHLQEVRERRSRLEKQLFSLVPVLRARIAAQFKTLEAKLQMAEQVAPGQPAKEVVEKYERVRSRLQEEKRRFDEMKREFSLEVTQKNRPRKPAMIWEKAEFPSRAESAPYLMLALTLVLGLALGVGLAFLGRPGVTIFVLLVLLMAALATFRYPARGGIKPSRVPPSAPAGPHVSVKGEVRQVGIW